MHTGVAKSKLCYDRRFSRPVCLGIKHPSGGYDQIFITVCLIHESTLFYNFHSAPIEVTKSKDSISVFHEFIVSESCVNSLNNGLVI
jgi:hypothetical protein